MCATPASLQRRQRGRSIEHLHPNKRPYDLQVVGTPGRLVFIGGTTPTTKETHQWAPPLVAELAEIAAARAALDARQQAITAQLLRIAQGDTP